MSVRLAGIGEHKVIHNLMESISLVCDEEEIEVRYITRVQQLEEDELYFLLMRPKEMAKIDGLRLSEGRLILTNSLMAETRELSTKRLVLVQEGLSLREITFLTQNLDREFYYPVLRMLNGELPESSLWGIEPMIPCHVEGSFAAPYSNPF